MEATQVTLQELASQMAMPPGNDPRIAAFSQAMIEEQDAPHIQEMLAITARRAGIAGSYAANLLLRSVQHQLVAIDEQYPLPYTEPVNWQYGLGQLYRSPAHWSMLTHDLAYRQTQSNVVERYKAVKLVAQLLAPRLGDDMRMLDVACSRNHGLIKIKHNLPFKEVACDNAGDTGQLRLLDRLISASLAAPLAVGACVGTDIVPLARGSAAAWTRSCSFYPTELLDEAAVAEYDYLDHLEPSGVQFMRGDFAGEGFDRPVDESFDVISASTFMYQLNKTQRQRARQLFRRHASQQGVIVYLDFAAPSPDNQHIRYKTNWLDEPYPYRTMVEFADDPQSRVYEVFRWDGGRCKRWIAGRDMQTVLERQ